MPANLLQHLIKKCRLRSSGWSYFAFLFSKPHGPKTSLSAACATDVLRLTQLLQVDTERRRRLQNTRAEGRKRAFGEASLQSHVHDERKARGSP